MSVENHSVGSDRLTHVQLPKSASSIQAKHLLNKLQQRQHHQPPEPNYKLLLNGLSELNDGVITSDYLSQSQKNGLNEILMATNNLTQSLAIQFTNNDIPSHIYAKLKILVENLCNLVHDARFDNEAANLSRQLSPQFQPLMNQAIYQQSHPPLKSSDNSPSYVSSRLAHQVKLSPSKFENLREQKTSNIDQNGFSAHTQSNRSNRLGLFQDRISNLSPSISSHSFTANFGDEHLVKNPERQDVNHLNRHSRTNRLPTPEGKDISTGLNDTGASLRNAQDYLPPPPSRFQDEEDTSEFDDEESHEHRDVQSSSHIPLQSKEKYPKNEPPSLNTPLTQNASLSSYTTPSKTFGNSHTARYPGHPSSGPPFGSKTTFDIPPRNKGQASSRKPFDASRPPRARPHSMFVTSDTQLPSTRAPGSNLGSQIKRASFLQSYANRRHSSIYDGSNDFY